MPQLTIEQALQLALQHHQAGRLQEAEQIYRQILAQQPKHAEALHFLGVIAHQVGRNDIAADLIRQAITVKPNYAEAHGNLGNALKELGRLDEAIVACRKAVAFQPHFSEAHYNLGNALRTKGEFDEAIAAYRQSISLKPNYAEAFNNLGNTFMNKSMLDEASAAFRQAIALRPDFAEAHNNLGMALKDGGQLDEAIAAFRQAITLNPHYFQAHSNLVYALHFHRASDASSLYKEHIRWENQHAQGFERHIKPHANDRDPHRRLRIGYVSPDFKEHPVGRFLHPLLAKHDHQRFEIFAYSQVLRPDALTDQLRSHTDHWRNLVGLSDEQAAQLIRTDQIDILVDLTMHMTNNRLLMFARKPAPVQITYLAYCSTTGLSAMDYRLSDPYLDPPGWDESVYTEKTLRLPKTYWCYEPSNAPPVSPAPVLNAGHITFGCLNNFCKVTESTLAMWASLLQAVPDSRLILHAWPGSHRQRTADQFQKSGVDPQRLRFVAHVPLAEYFQLYQQIDIALDPFPYGGGTTTCDALWMGVPVISLTGITAVSRSGLSILSNIGLHELVASTPDQYVQIAATLAADLLRLAHLRAGLRDRMQASPLMDARRFAVDIESVYQQVWQQWCAIERV